MITPDEARSRLRGVIVPTVTPFNSEGGIALDVLRRLLEFLADQGASGVIPGDLVGELFALTLDERRALLGDAVTACRGRMPVIALTAAPSVADAIDLARFARTTGADLIKVGLPYPWTPTPNGMLQIYRRIDDAAGMPFLIESSDDLPVPISVVAALCERSTFVGLEELGSSLSRLDRLYHEFADRLAILPSGDNAFLYLALMGAPGTIVAESNFVPRLIADFLAASQRRELDLALELFTRRRRYRDLFREDPSRSLPMFVPYTKAALELLGFPVGAPRPPQERLADDALPALREAMEREFGLRVGAAAAPAKT